MQEVWSEQATSPFSASDADLRHLFPPQFAVLMWILTYVGALFNGLTLLILGESTHFPSSSEAFTDGKPSFGSIWWCYEKTQAETFSTV